jgi:hypothetical protein
VPPWSRRDRDPGTTESAQSAFLVAVPRLADVVTGRVGWDGLERLIADGWTPAELAQVADSWPTLTGVGLASVLDMAGGLRRSGRCTAATAMAWTHALFDAPDGSGRAGMRELVRTQAAAAPTQPGSGPTTRVVAMYRAAVGEDELALAALAAGLTSEQAREQAATGNLNYADLKRRAQERGIDLP